MSSETHHHGFPKIPASNPTWSTGMISLMVSLVAGFASFYTLVRPEVQKYMQIQDEARKEDLKIQSETTKSALSIQSQMVTALLGNVQLNTNQIMGLQEQLSETKEENKKLKDRVTVIEKDFTTAQVNLEDCLDKLNKKGK